MAVAILHLVLTSSPALRDREAGSTNNRDKPTDDGLRQDRHANRIEGGRDRGSYDGRGGRGGRAGRGGRGNRDDRHTRGVPKYATPHPPYRIFSRLTSSSQVTTSSNPTNRGAHLPVNPNGKTSKQAKPLLKPKKKTKVKLADGMLALPQEMAGIPAPLRSPLMQLPQPTLTVPLRPRDLLPLMLQPNQSRSLSLRTTAALMPTTSPSKRKRS